MFASWFKSQSTNLPSALLLQQSYLHSPLLISTGDAKEGQSYAAHNKQSQAATSHMLRSTCQTTTHCQ